MLFNLYVKNDYSTNNMTESFNNKLNMQRGESVLSLIEHIKKKMMWKLQKRKSKTLKWTTAVPPNVMNKIEAIQQIGRHLRFIWATNIEFEVMDERSMIDLEKPICRCGA